MKWWHGGPPIANHLILPSVKTGAISTETVLTGTPWELLAEQAYNGNFVYIINSYAWATLFASAHKYPWVYQVEPIGDLEPDPDFRGDGLNGVESMRCPSAGILRRYKPSNRHIDQARQLLVRMAEE